MEAKKKKIGREKKMRLCDYTMIALWILTKEMDE